MVENISRLLCEFERKGAAYPTDRMERFENFCAAPITLIGTKIVIENGIACEKVSTVNAVIRVVAVVFAFTLWLPFTAFGLISRYRSKIHRADYLVSRAQEYLNSGRPDWAFADIIRAQKIQKEGTFALGVLAAINSQENKLAKGAEEAKKVLKTDPNNVYALVTLAFIHASNEEESEAVKRIDKAKKIASDHPFVATVDAYLLSCQGKQDEGQKNITKVLEDYPDNPFANTLQAMTHLHQGNYLQASNSIKKALGVYSEYHFAKVVKRNLNAAFSKTCFKMIGTRHDTPSVTKTLQKWSKPSQEDTFSLTLKLLAQLLSNQVKEAEETDKKITKLDSAHPFHLAVKGYWEYVKSKQEPDKIKQESIEKALELDPENPLAHFVQAKICLKQTDLKKGAVHVNQARDVLEDETVLTKLQQKIEQRQKRATVNTPMPSSNFHSPLKRISRRRRD